MVYNDLREFLELLEKKDELHVIKKEISVDLEMTEISQRVLRNKKGAILFKNPTGYNMPVVTNLFGTPQRVAYAMGCDATDEKMAFEKLREIGELLAYLKEPEPPKSLKGLWEQVPVLKKVLTMTPKLVKNGICQTIIKTGNEVDLNFLPIQKCWPDDVAPLITWGLTVTKKPNGKRQNLGIYRQQLLTKNKLIMRWLSHRGGALDFQEFQEKNPGKPFPVSVVLGCDPATILAAVTPIPDTLSEYAFAGLLRGKKTELTKCITNDLEVPSRAEIVLEGYIYPDEMAEEGPYGDHTGYYNETELFPVFTVETITHRKNPIYHSTYTGRPPDEPAILGVALNEVFVPLLKKQYPEIIDFYLPPEGCSYRLAIVSMKKQYSGHAKRVMMGVWSFLRQFMYTKFVIVVDEDIDIRSWNDVIWAMTTRMDPARDTTLIENTPIDYLDFASPVAGLGSKMGLDATNKWQGETTREWGVPIVMKDEVIEKIDAIWNDLGIDLN